MRHRWARPLLALVLCTTTAGCDLVVNTVEAPFVAIDHILHGQSNRERIRELSSENSTLEKENDSLESEVSQLKSANDELRNQAEAFDSMVSYFESSECFHVDRQGRYKVLIQPIFDDDCY